MAVKPCVHWTHFSNIFPTFFQHLLLQDDVGKMSEKCVQCTQGKICWRNVGEMSEKCRKKNWKVIYVGRMLEKCVQCTQGKMSFTTFLQHFSNISCHHVINLRPRDVMDKMAAMH